MSERLTDEQLRARVAQLEVDLEASRRCARLAQEAHDIVRARVAKLDREFWRKERERILSKPFDEYREDIEVGDYLAAIDIILETAE